MGWQWHQLDHMQVICTLLHIRHNHASISLSFYIPDALPDAQPTTAKNWRQCPKNFMIMLSVTIVSLSVFAIDVSNNDRCYDGGSSRCLLSALRTTSRHITTPESASLRCSLAVLHGVADGRAAGSVSLLSWPPTRHLLGFVSDCHCYYYLVFTLPYLWGGSLQPLHNPVQTQRLESSWSFCELQWVSPVDPCEIQWTKLMCSQ